MPFAFQKSTAFPVVLTAFLAVMVGLILSGCDTSVVKLQQKTTDRADASPATHVHGDDCSDNHDHSDHAHGDDACCDEDHGDNDGADHGDHAHGPGETCTGDDDHTHDHDGNAIEISPAGQNNIGLRTTQSKRDVFQRTVRIPARVSGRSDHWQLAVAAPIAGIVTKIHVTTAQSVEAGLPMFEVRITQQDVIDRQTRLLELLEQLRVVEREIDRLDKVVESGAVAGKSLLEQRYEKERLEASIRATSEGLELLGLDAAQVAAIAEDRKLIGSYVVSAPAHHLDDECCEESHPLTVARINVVQGQRVDTGESLATLGDYCKLQIEAFSSEADVATLQNVLRESLPISAVIGAARRDAKPERKDGLRLLYIDPEVGAETRSIRFVVDLENELIHEKTEEGSSRKFLTWKYRPGEWAELLLPLGVWKDRIVLPAEAVIQDGAESFVFLKHGNSFMRQSVAEEFRDAQTVVLKPNALPEGEAVVTKGAFRVYLALKNASGGAIDPHAGHSH